MIQNPTIVGQPLTAGANGPIIYAQVLGNPNTYALDANSYAVGCYLYQCDITTNFIIVAWQNTGTFAVPVWTQVATGNVFAAGTTKTLTSLQSGSTVLLDQSGGSTVTLPAPQVGLKFTFIASVTGAHKVITNVGTVFMVGMVALMEAAATSAVGCLADGTTDVSIAMNATTTGGIKGTRFTLECISSTVWEISGLIAGSGSLSTPIATS